MAHLGELPRRIRLRKAREEVAREGNLNPSTVSKWHKQYSVQREIDRGRNEE